MSGCGADVIANELLDSLTTDVDFTVPEIDLDDPAFEIPGDGTGPAYDELVPLTEASLTSRHVDGSGMFDGLMASFSDHLNAEYTKGRIAGAEYTKAYIALSETAMQNAVQYLLGKDQAFWAGQLAQAQAITARVQLEIAKVQLVSMQLEAAGKEASYALMKMKLATEDETYCLLKEQVEAARAQTLDTRSDGTPVVGVLGKQKALYSQQITSYERDAETKAAKLFTDAWITMKTMDEGLLPPNGFTNASIDEVLTAIKTNNNLD
jgi:hypothetical protein